MQRWIQVLTVAGWLLGAAVIIYGFGRYRSDGSFPAGLIALAVVIAGPLEDLLKRWVRRKTQAKEEPAVKLVDVATSAGFMILLLLAIYLLPPR